MTHQVLQVCAWRIKYLISLPIPVEDHHWRALAANWAGSRLHTIPLTTGASLYRLHLPGQQGSLTGSTVSHDIYAVLLRPEAGELLDRVMSMLNQLLDR